MLWRVRPSHPGSTRADVKLKIFEEARQQFRNENAWWRGNRDIKTLFAQEFLVTIRQIQKVPGAGPVYVERRGRAIRKWLRHTTWMPKWETEPSFAATRKPARVARLTTDQRGVDRPLGPERGRPGNDACTTRREEPRLRPIGRASCPPRGTASSSCNRCHRSTHSGSRLQPRQPRAIASRRQSRLRSP